MQGKIITFRLSPISCASNSNEQYNQRASSVYPRSISLTHLKLASRTRYPSGDSLVDLAPKIHFNENKVLVRSVIDENQDYSSGDEEEDELCPVECVREFYSDEEFFGILEKAKKTNALVVVDFYRTSCGSCKYIEQGFSKLCKASGDEDVPVIFLKHNVMDEYDEQSEVAERLRIKTVPLFHFYKNGTLLEAFPTRDKERITEAISRYISPSPVHQDD